MAIDPARLLAFPPLESRQRLSKRDTMLYALGVGATELDFIYEERLQALPTMVSTLAYPGFFWRNPEYGVDWRKALHAEQSIEIHAPLPVEGELRGATTIDAIFDKGVDKGALVHTGRNIYDAEGRHIATTRASILLRGDGGCGGGSAEAPKPHAMPRGKADHVVDHPTLPIQAAIYRLSGDHNPLHIDPAAARSAGFERPILHGLCTFGVAGRAILAVLAANDPARVKRIDARFSAPVYPGETIRTEIWDQGSGKAAFRASVVERGILVLNNGYVDYQ